MLLSLAAAVGLALMGAGLLWAGAVLIMLLRGLIQTLPTPVAAAANPGAARLPALARLATWRDLGAGVGPLLAGLLLSVLPASLLYGRAAVLVAASTYGVADRRLSCRAAPARLDQRLKETLSLYRSLDGQDGLSVARL